MHYNHHAIERLEKATRSEGLRDYATVQALATVLLDISAAVEGLEAMMASIAERVTLLEKQS